MPSVQILKTVSKDISIKLEQASDPKGFFKDGPGLYIGSSFPQRILDKAEPVQAGTSFELASYDLLQNSLDKEIESALPEKHLFSESDVCAIVADLISKQPKGIEGTLLNTGRANLFYTSAFVVYVYWYSSDSTWNVITWLRDASWWLAGRRVFSPRN